MRITLRNRIIFNFVLVIAAFACLGALAGIIFINRTTIYEEQRRVSGDLRSAWSVLEGKVQELSIIVNTLSTGKRVASVYQGLDHESSLAMLEAVKRQFGLDFLSLTNPQGQVILRTGPPHRTGDGLANDPFISIALKGRGLSGFYVLPPERLTLEGADLAERAFTVFEETPKAKPRAKTKEDSGLAVIAAAPVRDLNDNIHGVIYAGLLLNRNHTLVDQIRSLAFEDEKLDGRPVGTVTIFQWDVRVATNVVLPNGNRALGTRVSAEVYDKVLENGRSWYDRAFVVNDWYISAYDPIRDVEGKVIGILYVGVLARKYDDIRRNLWKIFGGLSLFTAVLVAGIGFLFSRRLTGSVTSLSAATQRLARGELDLRVPEPGQDDELRDLTQAFNSMAASLSDREARLKAAREELERTNGLLAQMNHNYLEMLGFISHELKNTLGLIYTSARTLSAGLAGELTRKQMVLVGNIDRNIASAVNMTRKYLDLTRIEKGELEVQAGRIDLIKEVIQPVLQELEEPVREKGVQILSSLPASLTVQGDKTLLEVVFKNLLDNALKYGLPGGRIKLGYDREGDDHRLTVWNSGRGLPQAKLDRMFDKFTRFETLEEGGRKGTGLGLFITRDIIVKHGGRIWAESEEGSWIRFVIVLPGSKSSPDNS